MREALAGLTTRGRAFLAAGTTAVACAVVIGQPALTRVGLLLVALPLIAAALLARSRYRLALVRTVTPPVIAAGQPARVELTLRNESRTPTGVLLLEDRVPYVLGARARFVLEGIPSGDSRRIGYQVRSDVRGHFGIGPMTVRASDPFGMAQLGRSFSSVATLTVTPPVTALPPIGLEGAWTGSGDNRPRAFATGSAEDVTVRDYRLGDDLRRVHWRSSARMGDLMVRREEQPWQSRATVFLDHRALAHRGQGLASSFEAAVQVAASAAVHLSQRGYTVRLVTAAGEDRSTVWHGRETSQNVAGLLEALAVVQLSDRGRIDTGWLTEAAQGSLVIAVLGSSGPHDGPVLSRMRQHASSALAVVLDVEGWAGRRQGEAGRTTHLARQGWRTATLRPGQRLEQVWQTLGTTSRVTRAAGGPG